MAEFFFHVPQFQIRPLSRPELRKDPIVDRWVLISTDRLGRPQEVVEATSPARLSQCPFCAGNEHLTPAAVLQVPQEGSWRVRLVPNTFPAIRGDGEFVPQSEGLFSGGPASGLHDVVIECPNHEARAARLPADYSVDLMRALAARMRRLRIERPGLYPFWFKNHGAASGASLEHAHSQLLGLPSPPTLVQEEIEAGLQHLGRKRSCIFCDLIEQERTARARVVLESRSFIAIAPYASRFPCELWLLPLKHRSQFVQIADDELTGLGEMYHRVLRKLDAGLDNPPLNAFIHTGPLDGPDLPHFHWHMEILPRLTGIAGYECGTGSNINPAPPEQAAEYLRAVDDGRVK